MGHELERDEGALMGFRPGNKGRRLAGLTGLALAASLLTACGGDEGKVPVINLYGGASATGFDKIIASCNKQSKGEYRIVGNLTPSDADSTAGPVRPSACCEGRLHRPDGHRRHLDRGVR